MTIPVPVPSIRPGTHRRHRLHDLARDWPETNCYVDLWIELVHAIGADPVAGLGFTVLQDFEGDQFTFFKQPVSDLELLYGVRVQELAVYDDLVRHLSLQVARGHLPLVEVDGYYLPDTKGISYLHEHTKTTIAINRIDAEARTLEYFHNAGYFALSGNDFDGLFRLKPEQRGVPDALFPYVELAKLPRPPLQGPLAPLAIELMKKHLASTPQRNPVAAYREHFQTGAARLLAGGEAYFHKYTFNVLRQLGANHELLASHLEWLAAHGTPNLERAISKTREISAGAKAFQFQLARGVMKRSFANEHPLLDRMVDAYDDAFADLRAIFVSGAQRLAS